jgi:hypothetical protein
MEFNWIPSHNVHSKEKMLSHVMSESYCISLFGNYGWENIPTIEENIVDRVNNVIQTINRRNRGYPTNNFLLPLGCDFSFKPNDPNYFEQIIPVIERIRNVYNITIKYSLLSEYFESIEPEKSSFKNRTDFDFMPFIENYYTSWSGFYTTYPKLKKEIRVAESYLRNANIFFSLTSNLRSLKDNNLLYYRLNEIEYIVSDLTHHDAITGTSKKFVNEQEYFPKIQQSIFLSEQIMIQSLQSFLHDPLLKTNKLSDYSNLKNDEIVPIVLFNSLSWERKEIYNLISNDHNIKIYDENNNEIEIQINRYDDSPIPLFNVYFEIIVPSFGFSTYFIKKSDTPQSFHKLEVASDSIENDEISLQFKNNLLNSLTIKSMKPIQLKQELLSYKSSYGSGKYIFTISENQQAENIIEPGFNISKSIKGKLVNEYHFQYNDWVTQIIRIYKNKRFIDFESKFNTEIPWNNEVISRFTTDIENKNVIYTDSNGLEMNKREYLPDYPIPVNYFPMVYSSYIKDNKNQLTIIGERTHGCGSIANNSIEVMLHRRTMFDDSKGVEENLNDIGSTVSPVIRMIYDDIENNNNNRHKETYNLNYPITTIEISKMKKSIEEYKKRYRTNLSPLEKMNENIHVLSFNTIFESHKEFDQKTILRVQHLYEKNESQKYSKEESVDLNHLFKNMKIEMIKQKTLSGMYEVLSSGKRQEVKVNPMEIKTMIVKFYEEELKNEKLFKETKLFEILFSFGCFIGFIVSIIIFFNFLIFLINYLF